ncbi:MAG: hypothetical protein HC873_17305 [Leptolyngbyaceae cyanobacterium SL_1_1]|nr:hypothetical protein [Leptolyngbyaceae cyanobacterium SL_1_1]
MRKYISWAIAHYWYAHRQAQSLEQAAAGILPLPRRRSQALPPVALFRQLMGWMQTGSVAIATNLFKESELVKTLGYRRHTLRQQSVQPRLPAAILPLKPSRPLVTYRQQVTQLLAKLRQSQALQRSPIADLPLLLKPASQSAVALKLTQFFSRQKVAQPRSVSWHEAYEPKLSDKETSDSLAATESAGSFSQIGSPPQSAAKSTQMTATATATVTAAPDWIETTATVIEYIEHPLEKLLRLIDQGLLWLEEKFAQLRDRLWKQS